MKQRVVVGLSGGVDSSVAAYLLQQQGYDVVGVFMRNWHDESLTISQECPWWEDSTDALLVAKHLSIPFHIVDFSTEYKQQIVDYMLFEYERGRTPNPDVLCNRRIKFDVFAKAAVQLGAEQVATGHYCRKAISTQSSTRPIYSLLAGRDAQKDQSYFLCQLTQQQLAKAIFPLGSMTKTEVRHLAEKIGLPTARKKDSQGLCFVGKIKLPVFLSQLLKPKKGNVVLIPPDVMTFKASQIKDDPRSYAKSYTFWPEDGYILGEHDGVYYYTVGQRKGLSIGGQGEPLFVIALDAASNTVYVGAGKNHPGLYRSGLFIPSADEHWVRPDLQMQVGDRSTYRVRIRYRQPTEECVMTKLEDGLYLTFARAQRGIAPGQFAAWYTGDELIGSGVIA